MEIDRPSYYIQDMSVSKLKYNEKTTHLKQFSKKNLYRKIYPSLISQKISDEFLSTTGYTKHEIIRDIYRLIDCNNHVSFVKRRDKKNKPVTDSLKIFDTNHCNIFTLCSICAEKVSRRRREKYRKQLTELAGNSKYAYMITFTTQNETTFDRSYESLTDAIRKYVLMGQLRNGSSNGKRKRSKGEAGKMKAMAVNKEIKKGKNLNLWHVHGHAIAFTDEKLDYTVYNAKLKRKIIKEYKEEHGKRPDKHQLAPSVKEWYVKESRTDQKTGEIITVSEILTSAEMELLKGKIKTESVLYLWKKYPKLKGSLIPVSKASREWLQVTGGTSSNIRFNLMEGDPDQIFRQCIEVIKYTSKISELNTYDILEVLVNRKGKRFFTAYGSLYNSSDNPVEEIEQEMENLGLEGYVWSKEKDKLIGMTKREMMEVQYKYDNREQLYKAKAVIMKGYYLKDTIKKRIMLEYRERTKGDKKGLPEYKLMVIKNINDLEAAYILYKRKVFKEFMHIGKTVRDEIKRPTSMQEHFLNEAVLFIEREKAKT